MRRFSRNASKITIALIVAIVAAAVLLLTATPAPAKPSVSWNPSKANETVLAGESITVPVSFTASKDLEDVVARVVPELEPFVRVSQTSFSHIDRGQTVTLDVVISPSVDALPQTIEGTIHLRSGGKPKRTFARPLHIVVEIVWKQFSPVDGQYELTFPPNLAVVELSSDSLAALSPVNVEFEPGDIGYPGPVQLKFYTNPDNLTPDEFFNGDVAPDLFTGSQEIVDITVDNHPAILFRNVQGLIGSEVVIISLSSGFLEITRLETSYVNQIPLELILDNIDIP